MDLNDSRPVVIKTKGFRHKCEIQSQRMAESRTQEQLQTVKSGEDEDFDFKTSQRAICFK